jgi:hypothetical protein
LREGKKEEEDESRQICRCSVREMHEEENAVSEKENQMPTITQFQK